MILNNFYGSWFEKETHHEILSDFFVLRGMAGGPGGNIWEMVTSFLGGVIELRTVEDIGEREVKNGEKVATSFKDGT